MTQYSFGKLIDGYIQSTVMSEAVSGFFPRFTDANGHVSSGVFDNVVGDATGSYLGTFGMFMGLLGGSILQQVLLLVALFFVALYLYGRCKGKVLKKGAKLIVRAGLDAVKDEVKGQIPLPDSPV